MDRYRIRELARARGLTQEGLSHASGVKIATVRRLWQNLGGGRASTLMAIARALGVTVEELVVVEGPAEGPAEGGQGGQGGQGGRSIAQLEGAQLEGATVSRARSVTRSRLAGAAVQ